jgi:hypothetical protein
MPKKTPDVRDQLREAIGDIPEGLIHDRGEVRIEWPIALYTVSESTTAYQNLLIGKRCAGSRMLDVSGGGSTDSSGKATISVKQVTCLFGSPAAGQNFLNPVSPINVVATPRSQVATHVTVQATLVSAQRDVQIEVFAWNAQGQAVGGAPFYWRAAIALEEVVG